MLTDGPEYVGLRTDGQTDTPDFTKCIRTSPDNDLKIGIISASNVLGSLTLRGLTGGAYNRNIMCIRETSHKKCSKDVLYTLVKR